MTNKRNPKPALEKDIYDQYHKAKNKADDLAFEIQHRILYINSLIKGKSHPWETVTYFSIKGSMVAFAIEDSKEESFREELLYANDVEKIIAEEFRLKGEDRAKKEEVQKQIELDQKQKNEYAIYMRLKERFENGSDN